MGTPKYPKNQATEWAKLKNAVKDNFTSANLRKAFDSITAGSISVVGGMFRFLYDNNNEAFYIGSADYGGQTVQAVYINRPDNSRVFETLGSNTVSGYWAFKDRTGSIIISDDGVSGHGLATPHILLGGFPTLQQSAGSFQYSETSSSYVSKHLITGEQFQPYATVRLWVNVDPSTVAQFRLRDGWFSTGMLDESVQISGGAGGTIQFVTLKGLHPSWSLGQYFQYDVEMRRVSGTGYVGMTIAYAHGDQS